MRCTAALLANRFGLHPAGWQKVCGGQQRQEKRLVATLIFCTLVSLMLACDYLNHTRLLFACLIVVILIALVSIALVPYAPCLWFWTNYHTEL